MIFTVVATCDTDTADPDDVAGVVTSALRNIGAVLIPCNWAPDPDSISEQLRGFPDVTVIDLNDGWPLP